MVSVYRDDDNDDKDDDDDDEDDDDDDDDACQGEVQRGGECVHRAAQGGQEDAQHHGQVGPGQAGHEVGTLVTVVIMVIIMAGIWRYNLSRESLCDWPRIFYAVWIGNWEIKYEYNSSRSSGSQYQHRASQTFHQSHKI